MPDEAAGDLADERLACRRRSPGTGRRTGAGCPSGWPSPAAMSAPYVAGRREDGERDGLDDRHEEGAGGVGEPADLGHRLEQAEDVGLGRRRRRRPGGPGRPSSALEGGEVGRPGGGAVGDERDLVEGEARRPAKYVSSVSR